MFKILTSHLTQFSQSHWVTKLQMKKIHVYHLIGCVYQHMFTKFDDVF